jgi:hypothetical protein
MHARLCARSCTHALVFGWILNQTARTIDPTHAPQLPGVASVAVNLVSNTAAIRHDPSVTGARDIIRAIEDCGFDASLLTAAATAGSSGGGASPLAQEAARWRRRLVLGTVLSAPVLVLSMGGMVSRLLAWRVGSGRGRLVYLTTVLTPCLPPSTSSSKTAPRHRRHPQVPAWMPVIDAPAPFFFGLPWSWLVQAVFSTAVQLVVGKTFYESAWHGVKRGQPNMQVGRLDNRSVGLVVWTAAGPFEHHQTTLSTYHSCLPTNKRKCQLSPRRTPHAAPGGFGHLGRLGLLTPSHGPLSNRQRPRRRRRGRRGDGGRLSRLF